MEKQVRAAVTIQRYFRGHLVRVRQRLQREFIQYRHDRLLEWKERGGPRCKPVVRLASSVRCLQEEFRRLQESIPRSICSVQLEDSDLFRWVLEVPGPSASPYQGGVFRFLVSFPPDHPHGERPALRCITPIFHCNIDENGTVCADGIWSFEAEIDPDESEDEGGSEKVLDLLQEAEEFPTNRMKLNTPRSLRIVEAVCSLLLCPSPERALHARAGELLRTRPREYWRLARDWTLQHAC